MPPADPSLCALYIRNIPPELHRQLRVAAAENGRTLREEVLHRLEFSFRFDTPIIKKD